MGAWTAGSRPHGRSPTLTLLPRPKPITAIGGTVASLEELLVGRMLPGIVSLRNHSDAGARP